MNYLDIFSSFSTTVKLKQKQIIVSSIIILIYFLSGFFSPYLSFFSEYKGIDTRSISTKYFDGNKENRFMWWKIENKELVFYCSKTKTNLNDIKIYGITSDSKIRQFNNNNNIRLTKEFAGSFAAVYGPIEMDINQDNQNENVVIAAKVDTIYTISQCLIFMELLLLKCYQEVI